jgi:hypothetical protein
MAAATVIDDRHERTRLSLLTLRLHHATRSLFDCQS